MVVPAYVTRTPYSLTVFPVGEARHTARALEKARSEAVQDERKSAGRLPVACADLEQVREPPPFATRAKDVNL